MAESRRFGLQITAIELCVIAALLDELHVGIAQTNRINAYQDLVGSRRGNLYRFGSAVLANALDPGPVGVPSQVRGWQWGIAIDIVNEVPRFFAHGCVCLSSLNLNT